MITGIAHVCYTVRDLNASIDFYCRKLGMKPAFDFRNEQGELTGIYLLVGDRNFLELFQGEPVQPTVTISYGHLCLEIDDIDTTVADLRAQGIAASAPIRPEGDMSWQTWITDPDGNRIELHAYTPESKQVQAMHAHQSH
jgi:catechol 2,3-dioxygenase-like lactoylglutathione lyase family enzyme